MRRPPFGWPYLLVVSGLVLGVFLLAGARALIATGPRYDVTVDTVTIGPIPRYLRPRVAALREGPELVDSPRSIVDAELYRELRARLLVRPWIASVGRIERLFPNGVHAQVTFREPLAVVVIGSHRMAVDREGVVVEINTTFAAPAVPELRLNGPRLRRIPTLGERFKSGPITEGLAVLDEVRRHGRHPALDSLRVLAVIVGDGNADRLAGAADLSLEVVGGPRLVWGRSPESPYAALGRTTSQKLDGLEKALRTFPGLLGLAEVDLRFNEPHVTPKRS